MAAGAGRASSTPAGGGTLTKTGSFRRADDQGSGGRTSSGRPREPGHHHGECAM